MNKFCNLYKTVLFAFFTSAVALSTIALSTVALCEESSNQSTSNQPSSDNIKNAEALLSASLGFIKQKIKDSGYALTSRDLNSIKRTKNTFTIPKNLRVKGIASIPVLHDEVVVKKINYSHPNDNISLTGFSFVSTERSETLSKLGIKNGDILYKVNNEIIRDNDSATRIFNKLKQSDKIEVELVRQNKIIQYKYIFI